MTGRLNKKVLCFVDESGTAGAGPLYFGAAIVLAREASRIDKCFSDRLEPNAKEVHAARMTDAYLQGLMMRFWQAVPPGTLVLVNRKLDRKNAAASTLYAQALVETVKAGIKCFRSDVLGHNTINNVEVIVDINDHNKSEAFDNEIVKAQSHGGLFKAVKHVAKIDSAASRILQIADVVAYSRKWIGQDGLDAGRIRDRFGISLL